MGPLAEHLAPRYSTVCVDWPGFGARARPQVDWTPDAYSAFLAFLLTSVVPHPRAVIAAGHAASYALKYAASAPQATTRLVLIAPTWRGPLPTVLGERRPILDRVRRLVDLPGIGPLVYRLNVNEFVVRRMGAGHVYTDPTFLTGERLRQKLAVVRAPGARFASARFVTGGLDPLEGRDGFLDLGRRARIPILLVYAAETPPRSRAEMEALAAIPGIRSITLPRGKLSVHEEFPGAVFEAMDAFLRE
jgi:pimeloyl-ACP methyl ester carboxylesterase